ncbi:MAG: hypothetical protein ACI4R5_03605 [Acetatifactor sp.]
MNDGEELTHQPVCRKLRTMRSIVKSDVSERRSLELAKRIIQRTKVTEEEDSKSQPKINSNAR